MIEAHIQQVSGLKLEKSTGKEDKMFETKRQKQLLAWYTAAIREVERQDVPSIGASIDRRTFQHLSTVYNEDKVKSLICFVCGQIKTVTHDRNTEIRWQKTEFLRTISEESFMSNLSFERFREDYSQVAEDPMLKAGCYEWKAVVTRLFEKKKEGSEGCEEKEDNKIEYEERQHEVLCCPEDVECTRSRKHPRHQLCENCLVPICSSCRVIMRKRDAKASRVPMALANGNFQGYLPQLIYNLKVRWIECAVACPCWTAQIIYYLEEA